MSARYLFILAQTDFLRVLRFLQSCSEILTFWITHAAAAPEARGKGQVAGAMAALSKCTSSRRQELRKQLMPMMQQRKR